MSGRPDISRYDRCGGSNILADALSGNGYKDCPGCRDCESGVSDCLCGEPQYDRCSDCPTRKQAADEIANYTNVLHAEQEAHFKTCAEAAIEQDRLEDRIGELERERDQIAANSVAGMTELTDRWEAVCDRERGRLRAFKDRLTSPDDWRDISGAASLRCPESTPCPKCIVEAAMNAAETEDQP